MPDRKKVIKGLEKCISSEECSVDSCPYYKPMSGLCFDRLAADALELIEEQQNLIDEMTKRRMNNGAFD